MPAITRIKPGPRMSGVVVHNGVAYVAGQVGGDEAGVGEQAKTMLAKVEALLQEAGADKTTLLSATVYLRDIAHFAAFNEVWDAWVPRGCAPARACVEARMNRAEVLCEVSVIAACGNGM